MCHGADREGYKADQAPSLAQQDFLASATPEFLTAAITKAEIAANGALRGGYPFLAKPVVLAEVVACIRHHLDGKGGQR